MSSSVAAETLIPTAIPPRSTRGPSASSEGYAESADGTRIHWYTVGEGEPTIVCCDGIGCDGYVWKYVTEELARDHRVIRWHYRAHGTSAIPADRSRMTMSDLCNDLTAVLDAHDAKEVVLLGHSLGVQVIFEYWRRHPERVKALVPMCGSYGRPLDTFHDLPVSLAFPYLNRVIQRFPHLVQKAWQVLDTELSYQIATRTEVNGALVKREDFRPYLNHLANMDSALFFTLLADASDHSTLSFLHEIDIPTLIVAGENDTFTPARLQTEMKARIPESELCVVPTGTHTAPIEMPELVNLRLRRFLEERVHPLFNR